MGEPWGGREGVVTDDGMYCEIPVFSDWGVRALVTTRAMGSFGTSGDEPVGEVMARWGALRRSLGLAGQRFVTASQVHGPRILHHTGDWSGWLRGDDADGHLLDGPRIQAGPMSAAVVVADCVPVFVVHPSGAAALLHAGWRGIAAAILPAAIRQMASAGYRASELRVHTGPAICGRCYEVGPEVASQLTGRAVDGACRVDLRAILADQARALGVTQLSSSDRCTAGHGGEKLFFSHRGGDRGRQVAALATPS